MTAGKENDNADKKRSLEQERDRLLEEVRRHDEDIARLRREKARLEKSVRDKEAIAASRRH